MKSAFLLLLPAMLLGQRAAAQGIHFGAKAGLNYSNLRLRDVTEAGSDAIFSYHAGGVARYAFGADGFWNLQAELLYSRKGENYVYTRQGAIGEARTSYLDLPVLAKINAHGLTFEAGPQVGYLLRATNTTADGTVRVGGLRKLQLGYAAGLGYELPNGLSLTVRYSNDLSGMYRGGGFRGVRNSVLQTQLGYLFGTRK